MPALRSLKGFTLIELLIVIAIILILIAIALPNFLEAQIRARVVNAEAEMRTMGTALESYQTDWRQYPYDEVWWASDPEAPVPRPPIYLRAITALKALTTPVQYLTEITTNPFRNKTDAQDDREAYFRYFAEDWTEEVMANPPPNVTTIPFPPRPKKRWSITSCGPNGIANLGEHLIFGQIWLDSLGPFPPTGEPFAGPGAIYAATNGTKSVGDLTRVGP